MTAEGVETCKRGTGVYISILKTLYTKLPSLFILNAKQATKVKKENFRFCSLRLSASTTDLTKVKA